MTKLAAAALLTVLFTGQAVLHRHRKPKKQHGHVKTAPSSPFAAASGGSRKPGVHLSRVWSLNKQYADASFHVMDSNGNNAKGCTAKDNIGETSCSFKWGESLKLVAKFNRTRELVSGSTFELEMDVKPLGMAALYQFDPVKLSCPVCGGMCNMAIPRMNGLQIVPTKEDLVKIPMMGDVIVQMAEQKGFSIPKTREDLSTMVNGLAAMAASMAGSSYEPDAFTNDKKISVGTDQISFPVMACPVKAGIFPEFTTPPMPEGAPKLNLKMDKNNLELETELPANIAGFDPALIELTGHVSFSLKNEKNEEITKFVGHFGINRPVPAPKDIKM